MRHLQLLPALLVVLIVACVLRIFANRRSTATRQHGEGPVDLPRAA